MRLPCLFLPTLGGLVLILTGSRTASEEPRRDADAHAMKQGQIGADGPALLEFFRKRTPSADHRIRIPALIQQLDGNRFAVRQEASGKLMELGVVALPFLRAASKGKGLEMTRRVESCIENIERNLVVGLPSAAARLLRHHRPAGAGAVLLDYLPYADDRAVEEEVLSTLLALGLADGKARPALVAALNDAVSVKRAAAALVVVRSAEPAQRAAALRLLEDKDPLVRLRAAQGLLLDRDRKAVPVLLALLSESPAPVAFQAEEILVRIAGTRAPGVALRPIDAVERRTCSQTGNHWWRERGAKLALPQMDDFRCQLGYTLVTEFANGMGGDRLVEIGPDGRTRWRIENLQYPVDATVLGDNRVLIVEHGAKRVCECDFKGTVLWQKAVSGRGPFAAQRLANGHTFIVSHHQLLEVDADGKEVWSRLADGTQYLGAQKMRDGQVIYLNSEGECVRLDAAGKLLKSFTSNHATHWVTGIDILPGGNILIPQHGMNKVVEFDPDGKPVWEAKTLLPKSATRLPNGRTLVTSFENRNVVELDRAGKVVWEYKEGLHPYRARRR